MKKALIGTVVLLFLASTVVLAQPASGKKWEIGTSISFDSTKPVDGPSSTILDVPVRVGYFIWRGLEIEPELQMSFFGGDIDAGTGILFSLNAAYNFSLTDKRLMPFVRAGYGFGNGFREFELVFKTEGFSTTAPNFGGGIKYFFGDMAAVRVEYRFTSYSANHDVGHFLSEHRIFVGFSIFF